MCRDRADRHTQVVRPEHDGEDTLPERQVQIADREEPPERPYRPGPRMLLNPDSFHASVSRMMDATLN